jgi:hypothetical protein
VHIDSEDRVAIVSCNDSFQSHWSGTSEGEESEPRNRSIRKINGQNGNPVEFPLTKLGVAAFCHYLDAIGQHENAWHWQRNYLFKRNLVWADLSTNGATKYGDVWRYTELWPKSSMLWNYAHHAQSPKSSVHSVYKTQGKAIWQTLQKLSYGSFFCGTMTPVSHLWGARWPITFSVENDQYSLYDRDNRRQTDMCTKEAYRGSYRTYRADMCTKLRMAMHMCRQTKSISVHAHVHKTDLLIDTDKRHARSFMYVISSTPMRRDSSAELFIVLHIASNSSAYYTKNQSRMYNSAV